MHKACVERLVGPERRRAPLLCRGEGAGDGGGQRHPGPTARQGAGNVSGSHQRIVSVASEFIYLPLSSYEGTVVGGRRGVENGPAGGGIGIFLAGGGKHFLLQGGGRVLLKFKKSPKNALF